MLLAASTKKGCTIGWLAHRIFGYFGGALGQINI
jgi:hypothetical protein